MMIDLKMQILPGSTCKMTEDVVNCTVSLSMSIMMMDEKILEASFTSSEIYASLFSMNGALKGDVELKLGNMGATYTNDMGLSKSDFQEKF